MDSLNYLKYDAEVFTPPFRLGKKQQRAVLDSLGKEVVIFPPNSAIQASLYVDYLNEEPNVNTSKIKKRIGIVSCGLGIEASIISSILAKNNNVAILSCDDLKKEPVQLLKATPDEYLSITPLLTHKLGKSKKKNNRKGHKRKKAKNGR